MPRVLIAVLLLFSFSISVLGEGRYVRTPLGEVWSACMKEVPSGTHIYDSEKKVVYMYPNGTIEVVPPCPMPVRRNPPAARAPGAAAEDGWQVWTTFQHPQNETFTSFLGYFTVPEAPRTFGDAILYLFTGLQSDNWVPIRNEPPAPPTFDIIQPVLQYGPDSEDGGGMYWALASWYVTLNNGAIWSKVMPHLQPGSKIFGNMTMTGPTTWYIGGTVNGQTTDITVTRPRLASQPWAYCTLEMYEIATCDWMPPSGSSCAFTELQLFDKQGAVTPNWISNHNTDHCTASLSVTDPATVTISW